MSCAGGGEELLVTEAASSRRFPPVILATVCVPWEEDFSFAEPLFRRAVRLVAERLTPYVYVFGTAGEGYAVSDSQFEEITSAFVDEAHRSRAYPCVGIISLSTRTVIERIERACELGASTFMIVLPSWGTCTDVEVISFFSEILPRFPTCAFIHYNNPRTGRWLEAEMYRDLSERFENLVGAKYSTTDFYAAEKCIRSAPAMQFLLTEYAYAEIRNRFECGLVPSTVTMSFERAHEFFHARGHHLRELADKMLAELNPLYAILARRGAHMDGAFDKALLRLHLPEFPLRLLPPYAGASLEAFTIFKKSIPSFWRAEDLSGG